MTFQKGQSGNPDGRPVGIRDKRVALRELLVPHADELVAKVVEMALAGDAAALRICIDRLKPAAKSKDDPVSLHDIPASLVGKEHSVYLSHGNANLWHD